MYIYLYIIYIIHLSSLTGLIQMLPGRDLAIPRERERERVVHPSSYTGLIPEDHKVAINNTRKNMETEKRAPHAPALHAKAARLPWPGRCPLGVSGIAIVQHVGDDQGRAWPGGWRHAAPPGPGHVRPHRPEEPRPVPGLHGRARPRRALHGAGAQGKDCGRPRPVILRARARRFRPG